MILKCETELKNKTEECEKLKIAIKDLKQIIQLNNFVGLDDEEMIEDPNDEKNINSEKVCSAENEDQWSLKRNGRRMKRNEKVFSSTSTKEPEHNCKECDFQGTSEIQLRKHMNLKHTVKDGSIKCRKCDEVFETKWRFMSHRKEKHLESVAPCQNNLEGRCIFISSKCWWNHESIQNRSGENIECFVCNETFENKPDMMTHRKKEHSSMIRPCQNFQDNNCRYQDESCWFKHSETQKTNNNSEAESSGDEDNSGSVFGRLQGI